MVDPGVYCVNGLDDYGNEKQRYFGVYDLDLGNEQKTLLMHIIKFKNDYYIKNGNPHIAINRPIERVISYDFIGAKVLSLWEYNQNLWWKQEGRDKIVDVLRKHIEKNSKKNLDFFEY